jgi:hypothetical protein
MPRLPFRIALFSSSYAPLFALLGYKNRHVATAWEVLAGITVLSVIALIVVMNSKRGERGPRLEVRHSRPKDGDVLAYTATYLVPFLGLNLSKSDDVVALCGFLLVLGIVYVNSDMLFVNPLLSLARYHSFWVTDQDGHEYSLITRRTHLDPGHIIHPAQVGRYVRIEVGDDRTRSP